MSLQYKDSKGRWTDDVQEAVEPTQEEVADHERAEMAHVLRPNGGGAGVCCEAFAEEMTIYEAQELADLMAAGLQPDAVEFDDAAIGRVCRQIMLRYVRKCSRVDQ